MKKKIMLAALVTICLTGAVSGTLAYFTSEDTAHNVITSGGVNIEVVEKMKTESGAELDFPANGVKGVMPGEKVSKIVSVKNTGESEAWIRVRVEAAIKAADGTALPSDVEGVGRVMTYTVGENWIAAKDSYYYYNAPVKANEFTEILFDTVNFAPEMGNEYQNCTADIVISAQAVQTSNNGKTVLEANGWPAEE